MSNRDRVDASRASSAKREGVGISDVSKWVRAHKWTFIVLGIAGMCVGAAVSFLVAPSYTAQVSLLPQQQQSASSLLGQVASLTGMSALGNTQSSLEPHYVRIIDSSRLLDRVINRRWLHRDYGDSVTVHDILGVDQDAAASVADKRRADVLVKRALRSHVIRFYRDNFSGYMILKVTVPGDPQFAADLANFLIEQLEMFNSDYNLERAEKLRNFLETRSVELDAQLQSSAHELSKFIEANRNYHSSPMLMLRYEELQREVQAETALWIELRKQLEMARIEAARDPETVTVLDYAQPPIRRSSPNRVIYAIAGFAMAMLIAVIFVMFRAKYHGRGEHGPRTTAS